MLILQVKKYNYGFDSNSLITLFSSSQRGRNSKLGWGLDSVMGQML